MSRNEEITVQPETNKQPGGWFGLALLIGCLALAALLWQSFEQEDQGAGQVRYRIFGMLKTESGAT